MYANIRTYIGLVIRNPFRGGFKTRDAVAISIILHLLVGIAIAFWG